jgi:hypothetical protein
MKVSSVTDIPAKDCYNVTTKDGPMQTRNWTTFAGTLEEFVANRKSAMRRRIVFAHAPLPDFPKIIVTKSAVDGVHLKGPRIAVSSEEKIVAVELPSGAVYCRAED